MQRKYWRYSGGTGARTGGIAGVLEAQRWRHSGGWEVQRRYRRHGEGTGGPAEELEAQKRHEGQSVGTVRYVVSAEGGGKRGECGKCGKRGKCGM